MTLPLLILAIDIATMVCTVLFGARVLAGAPRLRSAQLIALISFNTICHIVLSRYDYAIWIPKPYQFDVGSWAPYLNLMRNSTPGLFMVLCHTLFADRRRFPLWLLGLFVFQLCLEGPARPLIPAGWAYARVLTQDIPASLEGLFVGFALYWTLADWRADLIESRRRTRIAVLVIIGLQIIASSLLLRVVIPQDTIANYSTSVVLTVVNLAFLVVLLFGFTAETMARQLDPAHAQTSPPPRVPDNTDAPALARLTTLMEQDRIYRRESLSLKDLADKVGLPEYRLRRLIHERLGYPNFNAFLHAYRIRDACAQLRDPALRRTPILTIALSVGYQSINTFNRGFRDIMDMTPSAYRALETAPDAPETAGKITPNPA